MHTFAAIARAAALNATRPRARPSAYGLPASASLIVVWSAMPAPCHSMPNVPDHVQKRNRPQLPARAPNWSLPHIVRVAPPSAAGVALTLGLQLHGVLARLLTAAPYLGEPKRECIVLECQRPAALYDDILVAPLCRRSTATHPQCFDGAPRSHSNALLRQFTRPHRSESLGRVDTRLYH